MKCSTSKIASRITNFLIMIRMRKTKPLKTRSTFLSSNLIAENFPRE